MNQTEVMCACGEPLHYSSDREREIMMELVREHGEYITVSSVGGSWRIPRHYIALHGLTAYQIPGLAKQYGFEAVKPEIK